jgi:hypothetical protein
MKLDTHGVALALMHWFLAILFLAATNPANAAPALTNRIAATTVAVKTFRVPPKMLSALASTGIVSRTQGLIPIHRNVAEKSEVFLRHGTGFEAVPNAITNIRGETYLQASPGTAFYVRPKQPAKPLVLGTNTVVLPGELGMLLADGRKVSGQLYIQQNQDMAYDPGANKYRTSVSIGWQSTNSLAEITNLLPVHVKLKTDELTWNTNYVSIGKPGIPGEGEVLLTAQKCLHSPKLTARSCDSSGLIFFDEADVMVVVHCPGFWEFFGLLFPLPVWIALGFGATLGATLRYFFPLPAKQPNRRRVTAGRRLVGVLRHLTEGLFVAVATYILLSVGFTWSEAVPPDVTRTLRGAAAWGVVAGYLGAEVIERMLRPLTRE